MNGTYQRQGIPVSTKQPLSSALGQEPGPTHSVPRVQHRAWHRAKTDEWAKGWIKWMFWQRNPPWSQCAELSRSGNSVYENEMPVSLRNKGNTNTLGLSKTQRAWLGLTLPLPSSPCSAACLVPPSTTRGAVLEGPTHATQDIALFLKGNWDSKLLPGRTFLPFCPETTSVTSIWEGKPMVETKLGWGAVHIYYMIIFMLQ